MIDIGPVPDQKIAAWPGHTTSTIKNDGRAARQKSILADNDGSIVTSFLFIVSPPVSVDCPLHDHRLRFVRFHANANRKCKFQTQQLGYVPIGFCYNYLCTHLRYVRVCVALQDARNMSWKITKVFKTRNLVASSSNLPNSSRFSSETTTDPIGQLLRLHNCQLLDGSPIEFLRVEVPIKFVRA